MSYSSFIGLTNQFKFCGNAFRIDTYKGCTFGCSYCFANNQMASNHQGHQMSYDCADVNDIDAVFHKAFDSDVQSNQLTIELLRKRVPLHCGGMADPFQHIEFEKHITKHLIDVSNKYNYPIIFSTKACELPEDYFEILNPKIHAFQISLIGVDDEWCSHLELNTPTPTQRINFLQKLRDKGFWCSIRIQPIIDIEQAKELLHTIKGLPSYITVEHLKIPQPNLDFFNKYNNYIFDIEKYIHTTIYYELPTYIKKKNVEDIIKIANLYNVKVGVGDNDLHYMSQSRCCCGIDVIGSEFNNYLRYNSTYLTTGDYEIDDIYIPNSNCKSCLFSHSIKHFDRKPFVSFKEVVDDYIQRNSDKLHIEGSVKLKKLF